jgi:hypothetical protein
MFPEEDFPCENFAPLSWYFSIERVLAPAAATLLIMEDMKVGEDKAVEVLKDSRAYGFETYFLDDSDGDNSEGGEMVAKGPSLLPVKQEDIPVYLLPDDKEVIDLTGDSDDDDH